MLHELVPRFVFWKKSSHIPHGMNLLLTQVTQSNRRLRVRYITNLMWKGLSAGQIISLPLELCLGMLLLSVGLKQGHNLNERTC